MPGSRTHRRSRTGWRSVIDPGLWRQGFVAGTLGAVSMALLACAAALARDTSGHDWYAAYRITVADILIGVGFDGDTPVEYRNADGAVESLSRFGLTHGFEARWARKDILEAAWKGAMLGALSGFGGALLCLVLAWPSMCERRGRRPAYEPVPDPRSDAPDRLASAPTSSVFTPVAARPGFSPCSATAAPDRTAVPEPPDSQGAEPAGTRRSGPGSDKDNRAEPDAEPARHARRSRQRDYGRWV